MRLNRVAEAVACAVVASLCAGGPAAADELQILGYRFDPVREGEPEIPAELRAREGEPGFRLVQLDGPPTAAEVAGLGQAGARVLQYYPDNAYLVWVDSAGAPGRLPFVRWTGLVHAAYKINDDLKGRSGVVRNVEVLFYAGAGVQETLAALAARGATVLRWHPAQPDGLFYSAIVELPADAVNAVAGLAGVVWLGYESPRPVLDDEMSDQIVAGNYSGGVPFTGYDTWLDAVGLSGAGVTWAVIDTGVDYDHPDLGSHIVGGYSYPGACNPAGQPGSDCSGGGHGTHVAGIVGGDATGGFGDPNGFLYGLGVAPAYGIFASNSLSASAWPPAGGWQEHSKRAVLGGAIGGNNSWTTGEGTAHGYQASERTHDFMVRDGNFDTGGVAEPFIEVFSAGNSGPGPNTLTAPKEAKNLIIVANSLNFRAGSIDSLSSSSSRGPAVDGRIVPTVAAPGSTIASSRNDLGGSCSTPISGTNNLYAFCSGTSMAAPHVSGAIVLITEWWRDLSGGADPSAALAKALLVNSAVDMGTPDIPNPNEGWGRVNLGNLFSTTPRVYRDQVVADAFDNVGEQRGFELAVPNPASPLKVSVAWSDAPGAAGANPALVNNLDLTVVTGGNTFLGNRFSGGWSVTGGSPDTRNNIENVFVQSPGATVTITVRATNLPGDGIPFSGDTTDQDFSLVCSNCATGPVLAVDPDAVEFGSVPLGQTGQAVVDVSNVGQGDLAISDAAVSGPDFGEGTDGCSGQVLAPGASCAVQVTLTPTVVGSRDGTLTLTSNAVNGTTKTVPLHGVGTALQPLVPQAIAVDPGGNGVIEPAETASIEPAWRNPGATAAAGVSGSAVASGALVLVDPNAGYGTIGAGDTVSCAATGNCYAATAAGPRPGLHWDERLDETLNSTESHAWTLHVGASFADTPPSHGFYRFVETLLHNAVSGGCGVDSYCPDASTTRGQMAAFVLRSHEGSSYLPPPCAGGSRLFADVPAASPFCPSVEELSRRGVVGGCGGGNYCPDAAVPREQMPVFVLVTLEGNTYAPPPCVPGGEMFQDVPASSPFCRWVEEFARRGITGGCGPGTYCPSATTTRGQMAVFLTAGFGLTLYAP